MGHHMTIQMKQRQQEGWANHLASGLGFAAAVTDGLKATNGREGDGRECACCGMELEYSVVDDHEHHGEIQTIDAVLENGDVPTATHPSVLPPRIGAGLVVAVLVLILGGLGVKHTDPWGSSINFWRFGADMIHITSRQVLLWYMVFLKTAAGISLISQEAYLLVFLTRYSDLVNGSAFYSKYLTLMKLAYIGSALASIFLIRFRVVAGGITESPGANKICRAGLLGCTMLAGCVAVSLESSFADFLWILSQVLEAVSLVPQVLAFRHTLVSIPNHVMFFFWGIGAYRFLYIVNWMHRSAVDPRWLSLQVAPGTTAPVAWVCGAVQELVFIAGIFYLHISRAQDAEQGVFRIAKLRLAAAAAGSPITGTPTRTPNSSGNAMFRVGSLSNLREASMAREGSFNNLREASLTNLRGLSGSGSPLHAHRPRTTG